MQNQMSKTAQKVASITKKMDEMKNAKVPTEEYKEVQAHIAKTKDQLTALNEKMEKYVALGGKADSKTFRSMQYDASQLQNTLAYLEGELRELESSGKAFTNQTETDAYKNLAGDLRVATGEMDLLNIKEQEALQKLQEINGTGVKKLSQSAQKASNSMRKLAKDSTKANKNFSMLGRTIKQMALSMVLFQVMFKGIEFLKSGLQNLAVYSKEYNAVMSELMSSTSQLKNAFAVAFQPILNVVIPILAQLIGYVSQAANAVSRFFAILGGKSSYTKAIKQNKDYAASLDKIGGSADDAKGSLAGFDDLDVLQNNDSASGGATDGADASGFVEEAVGDISGFERIKQVLGKILDIFKTGFAAGLGDWESRTEDIRSKTEIIREALRDIFTDTLVVSGAQNFAESLIYALGQIVGAVASIGLTIGQNLVGGIALYLQDNTESIKRYIVDMFDIGADVSAMLGNFAQAFSHVFEAFGGESGQQLTANMVGMFADALMGVQQVCARLTRDIIAVITQPFVDNAEGFRTALEGFLGIAADVFGSIKDTIDNAFGSLLEVYDTHIKPFVDSVVAGLTSLGGQFLEFWNTQVQPVMDNLAAKFDEVMGGHISPLFEAVCGVIGSVVDALRVLWEETLQPLIAWVIENVLPVLLPIFEVLLTGIMECFGFIADVFTGFLTTLQGVIDFIVAIFTGDWQGAWDAVSNIVKGVMDAVSAKINLAMTTIRTIVNTVLTAIIGQFKLIFTGIRDFVTSIMERIDTMISGALKNISEAWCTSWNNMKNRVVAIFNGIWSSIKGVINSIIGGVEKMANGVINAINAMINALNNLSFTAPDWVPEIGGKSFGFNLSTIGTISIPRLANGGITTGSTLANIGEAGREAVLPLENNTGWMDDLADKLAARMPAYGAPAQIIMELDGKELARGELPYFNAENARIGVILSPT